MKLRRCATTPIGMAGTSAFASASSANKPCAVRFGVATLGQVHETANYMTVWSMGPTGGSTG